jgi:triacylglycerol lipase
MFNKNIEVGMIASSVKLLFLMAVVAAACATPRQALAKNAAVDQQIQKKGEYVVLLHGILRSDRSMKKIEEALAAQGYETVNIDYPSRSMPIKELAEQVVAKEIEKHCVDRGKRVHFVTHSMGGLVARAYLSTHKERKIGRVVMLAPPNQGSAVAEYMSSFYGFGLLFGPAGLEMKLTGDSIITKLPPVDYEVGIIAGNASWRPVLSLLIGSENDGTVSVESTKLEGMKDHIVLPVTHTFLMRNAEVIHQVERFLSEGSFEHRAAVVYKTAKA